MQQKKNANEQSDDDDEALNLFAIKKASLDDLEAKYLLEKGTNTRVVPIVLGNATGPDPFFLVTPATTLALSAGESPTNTTAGVFDQLNPPVNANATSAITPPIIFKLSSGKTVTVPVARPNF